MAKINRYDGNVQAFAAESLGTERTIFGSETQADTLDQNINADFLRGWGIVGVNENPTKQDFNAAFYTLGQLIAYLHQAGIPEWNAAQEVFEGGVVTTTAGIYRLKAGGDSTVDPDTDDGTNWDKAPTAQEYTRTFESVADLQASSAVVTGQFVRTLGYYTPGDGGGNDYEIVAAATGTADGVSFIDLNNGLQAKSSATDAATFNIPTDFPDLQTAIDALSYPASENKSIILNLETGYIPTSGLVLEGGDWSNISIRSVDATVSLGVGAYFDNTFVWGRNCSFPVFDCLFDCAGNVEKGLHSVEMGKVWVRPSAGFINASIHNFECRSSRADINQAVFDGAGEVGVRIQQASNVRAQSATANNCGVIGFDVSRGSTANLMITSATGCGSRTEIVTGDPNFINQGGIVVRRSLVAANEANVSGSTRGFSVQQSAHVEAGSSNLNGCTISGGRATTSSRLNLSNSTALNCASVGITAGFGSFINAYGVNFTGSVLDVSLFGTGAKIDVSTATLINPLSSYVFNGAIAGGSLINNAVPTTNIKNGTYSYRWRDVPVDSVVSFTPPGTGGGRGMLIAIATGGFGINGLAWVRVSNVSSQIVAGGPALSASTGVPTGTTGAAGDLTVSPASDGNVYLEFRGGGPTDITITILSQTLFDS